MYVYTFNWFKAFLVFICYIYLSNARINKKIYINKTCIYKKIILMLFIQLYSQIAQKEFLCSFEAFNDAR